MEQMNRMDLAQMRTIGASGTETRKIPQAFIADAIKPGTGNTAATVLD